MTEEKLRDYFNGQLTPKELSSDLEDSQRRTSYDVTAVYIDNIEDGEFEVKREHLVKLCDDVISGQLALTDLNTIGFALMASDYYGTMTLQTVRYWQTLFLSGTIRKLDLI